MNTITIGIDPTTSERTYYYYGQPVVGPVEFVPVGADRNDLGDYKIVPEIVTVVPTRQSDRGITPGWFIEVDPNPESGLFRRTLWLNVVDTNPDTRPDYEPQPYVYDRRRDPFRSECE